MTAPGPRRLALIRIVHSQAELGSLREDVRRALVAHSGEQGWVEHVSRIDAFWQGLRERILALDLDWKQVVLYQDSLPTGPTAMAVLYDLAVQGSLNHKLVAELVDRGARVEGTEDINMLLEEVEAVKSGTMTSEKSADLIARRDSFIADRVDLTLNPGETGLLFLGLAHDVLRYLPADIILISDLSAAADGGAA